MKKSCTAFILCVYTLFSAVAQTPAGRLYLHLDREGYTAGEAVWFRGYIHNDMPGVQSSSLFAELADAQGNKVVSRVFPVLNGNSLGQLELHKGIRPGLYVLRAWTPETPAGMEFYRLLPVLQRGIGGNYLHPLPGKQVKVDVQPLANSVVAGLPNVFSCVVYDEYFRLLTIESGEVVNSHNEAVTSFTGKYPGAAIFAVTPLAGEEYEANITVAGGATYKAELPVAAKDGIIMQTAAGKNGKTIKVAKTAGVPNAGMTLKGIAEGEVIFEQPLTFTGNDCELVLPYNAGVSGPVDLVVTSGDRTWCNTRVLLDGIAAPNVLKIEKTALNAAPKALNSFTLAYADTVHAWLSVAVTDAGFELPALQHPPITAHAMAGGRLRLPVAGKLPQEPAYYELLHNSTLYNYPEESNAAPPPHIWFSGYAAHAENGKPAKNETITCMIREPGNKAVMELLETDSNGYFSLAGLIFSDTARLVFTSYVNGKPSQLKVRLTEGFGLPGDGAAQSLKRDWPFITGGWRFGTQPAPMAVPLRPSSAGLYKQADEMATVVARKSAPTLRELLNRYRDSLRSPGIPTGMIRYSYDFINTPPPKQYTYFVDYIRQIIPRVRILWHNFQEGLFRVERLGVRGSLSYSNEPVPVAIYLDDRSVPYSQIQGLLLADVALVLYYADEGGPLLIYTRLPGDYPAVVEKKYPFPFSGYSPLSFPEMPDYDRQPEQSGITDNRSLLYWNPVAEMDANTRQLPIKFYNSDNGKIFKVVVQGTTAGGRYIYYEQYLKP